MRTFAGSSSGNSGWAQTVAFLWLLVAAAPAAAGTAPSRATLGPYTPSVPPPVLVAAAPTPEVTPTTPVASAPESSLDAATALRQAVQAGIAASEDAAAAARRDTEANAGTSAEDAADAAAQAIHDAATPAAAATTPSKVVPLGATSPLGQDIGNQIFFDAKSTGFNRDLNRQDFQGDVVAIAAGTLIAADKISLDRGNGLLAATGHVVLLNAQSLFIGDDVTYHMATGDFRLTNAVMLLNDEEAIQNVTGRLLGFTPKELAFEQARRQQLVQIEQQKDQIRKEAQRATRTGGRLPDELVQRYALLLERQKLIEGQENPTLGRLPVDRRTSIKKRRAFWKASQASALKAKATAKTTAYFHIEGEQISRINGNDYTARDALFTPCRCHEGESPAWAFRADSIFAQVGGYADLEHPVLEIKGIPVLYLPYLKVPIKDKRQSGFLLPLMGYDKYSGNIYSQPVYFALSNAADTTVTADIFEKRGTRLGVEYRVQQNQSSGWEMKAEGMRDSLWLDDRGLREELTGMYKQGLDSALGSSPAAPVEGQSAKDKMRTELRDPAYWRGVLGGNLDQNSARSARDQIATYLGVPGNVWRGSYSWRGVSFLAPRLSLVANGDITSDHRYSDELYLPSDFQTAFLGAHDDKAFSAARAQLNLDGRDFYAGLGPRFGDNYLLPERFEGQQIPLRFKLASRSFGILPSLLPVPVYGQISGEQLRITDYKPETTSDDASGPAPLALGDGSWRRIKFSTVSPWVTDHIVQVNQFADFESRQIEAAGLPVASSEIRSWRTGLEFRLPIDGKGELPDFLQEDPCTDQHAAAAGKEDGQAVLTDASSTAATANCLDPYGPEQSRKYVHHIMDWRLRFSIRPSVVRRGPYADPDPTRGGGLTYFASDKALDVRNTTVDNDVPDEERMAEHQRVTLFTEQVWKLFTRSWQRVPADGKPPAAVRDADARAADEASSEERARRELLYSMGRPASDAGDLYDEANRRWLIDRYRLSDNYYETPVTFRADIAYDFLDAQARDRIRAANRGLPLADQETPPEAWKDLNTELGINYHGWGLSSTASYNIYLRTAETLGLSLTPPSIFNTTLSLSYTVSKGYDATQRTFAPYSVRGLDLATSLIPQVTGLISIRHELIDGNPSTSTFTNGFQTSYGVKYASQAQCWGLQFLRQKDYGVEERDASYLMQLSVSFMGQERALPDMSPAVIRRLRGDDDATRS